MTTLKENLDLKIGRMLQGQSLPRTISRRLFIYDFTHSFLSDQERGFQILDRVRDEFRVPFSAVKIAGSAQVGYSYYKRRDFTPQVSDLDIAIISQKLFQQYSELVFGMTRRYTDLSKFQRRNGISTDRNFRDNLAAGFFRPDLMPSSSQRDDWFSFFTRLSNEHADLFKSISAGIYMSEYFFEMRNASLVEEYRKALR